MPIKSIKQFKNMFRMLTRHFREKPVECDNHIDWHEWTDDNKIYCGWIGHATLLLKINGLFIITDPVFSKSLGVPIIKYIFNVMRDVNPAMKIVELPPIDLVLISHAHMDHLDLPTLKKIKKCDTLVSAKHLHDLLHNLSVRQAFYLDHGDIINTEIKKQHIQIQALKPIHWGTRAIRDKHRSYISILLKFNDNKSIFFAGDTAYTEDFSVDNMIAKPTLALLPISAYDPFIKAHCTPEQALDMAINMQAENVIAYHHETFNLSSEPMDEPRKRYEAYEIDDKINRISLQIGETVGI